ncbi:hypothetical protein ACFVT1_30960 [Streptomyces sp. NPDC057963]|uniref:hypothetical protein n=1 Tax=Streptomyces sp. NPDC057963 TaxID=3346290 RepID=UPI0036EEB2BC
MAQSKAGSTERPSRAVGSTRTTTVARSSPWQTFRFVFNPTDLVGYKGGAASQGKEAQDWEHTSPDRGSPAAPGTRTDVHPCEGGNPHAAGTTPIPAAERTISGGPEHQNVGVFYQVRITGGQLRPEPNGETVESVWTPIPDVACLRRSSPVDVGLALAQTVPETGHVAPVQVGGLIQH